MASNPVFYPNLQQQQPVVYMQPQQHQESENAPFVAQNLPYHDSIYAQPQPVPEQVAPQPAPLQAQSGCAVRQCAFSKCCKKFNKVKAQKAALILPIIIFTIGTIKSFFSFGRYHGWNYSNIFSLAMVIISSVVGFIAIKKNKMHLHGVHIGMNIFLILSFFGFGITSLFAGLFFYNFHSFWSILTGFLELVAVAAQIASVVFSLKDIKRIKAELELPLDQQHADEPTVQEITLENTQIPPVQPVQQIPQPVQVPQPVPVQQPAQVVQQQQQQQQIAYPVQAVPAPQPSLQNKFKNELVLLREMGFANEILNIQLLAKHNGNLQAVVQEYIQTH